MTQTKIILDDAKFKAFLAGPDVTKMLDLAADSAKAGAVLKAPFDPNRKSGAHYHDTYFVRKEHNQKLDRQMRVFGNSSELALIIEYGTKDTPAFRTLRYGLNKARGVLK
jgi:hypothetical protein